VIRDAALSDLPAIVDIYNAAIPGRLATADTTPVSIDSRRAWFDAHVPAKRPLWVLDDGGALAAWASLQSFYGRPAYDATVEFSIYVAQTHLRRGLGGTLMRHIFDCCPSLAVETLIGFVFAHNAPSLRLCESFAFERWGLLPRVARLDGVERDVVILGRRL
jgi:L-amino acid N-acyltransferase YncA